MSYKRFVFALISAVLLGLIASPATFAHVLITDTTNTKGAVLHLTPDDDPIAGQPATLYLDVQDLQVNKNGDASLVIRASDGSETKIIPRSSGALFTATYTFPTQGVYLLTYIIQADAQTYTFTQSQRVSRGVSSQAMASSNYPWAQIVLVATGVSALLLVLLIVNRRKAIAQYSKL